MREKKREREDPVDLRVLLKIENRLRYPDKTKKFTSCTALLECN